MKKIITLIICFHIFSSVVTARIKNNRLKKLNMDQTQSISAKQLLKEEITAKPNPEKTSQATTPATPPTKTDEPEKATPPPTDGPEPTEKLDEKKEEKKDIYLNFENAELSNFINYIGDLKKLNLIPHATTAGSKISLTIREPLSVDGAWKVFLTVIEMAGFSIIKRGDVDVIIQKDPRNISRQPLKSYINVPLESLPDSDINIRYVAFLENIPATDTTVQDLLKSMLSTDLVQPYADVNGFIITDKSYNIKSAMKVINELDQIGLQEAVVVMRLQRANAPDVKDLLTQFIPQPQHPLARLMGKAERKSRYFATATKIIAEPRTNSLILMGTKSAIKKIEDFITQNIDTELKDVESPIHIYELQNTDAQSIAQTLTDILGQITEKISKDQGKKYGAVRGGVKYFKPMTIKEDTEGNRLVVAATDKQDWELLQQTIKDLDKPQPQVAIETLIVSVKLEKERELGGAIRNKNEGQLGKGINFQSPTSVGVIGKPTDGIMSILGDMAQGLTNGLGSAVFTFGKGNNGAWGIFKALQSITHTRLLSQPFFTVANNHEAHIKIGETVYIEKEKTASGSIGKEAASANTEIQITPQINLDGIMRLAITVNFNEFTDRTSGAQAAKQLKTDVTVADGQVLVLGGFITTAVTENTYKTPVLGDIPILGWLFKQKGKIVDKEHVFIFISPTIIKPRTTPGTGLYTRMKLHDAKDHIKEVSETENTRDPIHNWFFDPKKEDYSHKVTDYATARYQPTTVDIKYDPYYRVLEKEEKVEKVEIEERVKEITEKEITKEELFTQKREKLKRLISAQPLVREKEKIKALISMEPRETKKREIKIDESKREEFKKLLSVPPTLAQNKIANEKMKTLLKDFNPDKLKHLKKRKPPQLNLKRRRSLA